MSDYRDCLAGTSSIAFTAPGRSCRSSSRLAGATVWRPMTSPATAFRRSRSSPSRSASAGCTRRSRPRSPLCRHEVVSEERAALVPAPALFRSGLRLLLSHFPRSCPLEAQTLERVDLGDMIREKVRYQVEPGEWAPAYLFVPARRTGRGPAVLCLHQHAGQFALGKSEPAGLAGNPQQFYALELARRGYGTLAADAICFEELRDATLEGAAFERFTFTRLIAEGSTLQTKMLSDAIRGIDYLVSRPEVNPVFIGCVGHSLGGQQTLFAAA